MRIIRQCEEAYSPGFLWSSFNRDWLPLLAGMLCASLSDPGPSPCGTCPDGVLWADRSEWRTDCTAALMWCWPMTLNCTSLQTEALPLPLMTLHASFRSDAPATAVDCLIFMQLICVCGFHFTIMYILILEKRFVLYKNRILNSRPTNVRLSITSRL